MSFLKLLILLTSFYVYSEPYENKLSFLTGGADFILSLECPKTKTKCHTTKHDNGGWTCCGITLKYHANFLSKAFSNFYNTCTPFYVGGAKAQICEGKTLHRAFSELYYNAYFKKYNMCTYHIALALTDFAVNAGHTQAVKEFQRAYKLEADGKFGPASKKACKEEQDLNKYYAQRIKFYKGLKSCQYFCKGWINRVNKLKEYINSLEQI